MTLADPVRVHAESRPDAPAVVTPGGAWTWRDLDARVDAAARRLPAVAVEHPAVGPLVAAVLPTTPEAVALVLGAWRAGVALAPLSARWPAAARADALARMGLRSALLPDDLAALVAPAGTARGLPELDLMRPFTIVHTSGSTGAPRAAVHTGANHVASGRGLIGALGLAAGDRWLLDLPLAHVGGLGVVVRCALAGATVAVPTPGTPTAEALHALAPTHVSLVPTQLWRLVEAGAAPAPSLRAALVGGAALAPVLAERAAALGWPVRASYGLTEMTSTVTVTAPDDAGASAGDVLPGREVRIAEPDPDPRLRGEAGDGEIVVGGDALFAGFLDGARLVPPADGYATGDLGRWDAAGRLVVVGRTGTRFKVGGEYVQPEAVEAALAAVDGVAEAVVVPVPDAEWGARPVAFVRPRGAARPSDGVLADGVRRVLPGVAVPVAFHAWDGPAAMKPDRVALAALARGMRHGA